jgi:hypothetical protein
MRIRAPVLKHVRVGVTKEDPIPLDRVSTWRPHDAGIKTRLVLLRRRQSPLRLLDSGHGHSTRRSWPHILDCALFDSFAALGATAVSPLLLQRCPIAGKLGLAQSSVDLIVALTQPRCQLDMAAALNRMVSKHCSEMFRALVAGVPLAQEPEKLLNFMSLLWRRSFGKFGSKPVQHVPRPVTELCPDAQMCILHSCCGGHLSI